MSTPRQLFTFQANSGDTWSVEVADSRHIDIRDIEGDVAFTLPLVLEPVLSAELLRAIISIKDQAFFSGQWCGERNKADEIRRVLGVPSADQVQAKFDRLEGSNV